MTLLDPAPIATRSPHPVRDALATVTTSSRSAHGVSTYVTAPGAVPVRIGSYRRGVRGPRPVVVAARAELTYGDFFATPGA